MEQFQNAPTASGPRKKWTLLLYIAADNDLSQEGLKDIDELCEAGSSDDLYVAVEIDTQGFHGSLRYEITEPDWSGVGHRKVIERLPEQNSGDPRTLSNFLIWGLGRYPADAYMVVIWGHGNGFRNVRKDVLPDDLSGSSLDIPEIEKAFKDAYRILNKSNDFRIDILGFDACLMGMLEIANEFSSISNYIVGSQQTVPSTGWHYQKVLHILKSNPTSKELARQLVDIYISEYKQLNIQDVSQSSIDTDLLKTVTNHVHQLGDILFQYLEESPQNERMFRNMLRKARMASQEFDMADYIDIIHFLLLLREYFGAEKYQSLLDQATLLEAAVKAAVINTNTFGRGLLDSNGLSLWYPAIEQTYMNHRAKYLLLTCNQNKECGWVGFLDEYHTEK